MSSSISNKKIFAEMYERGKRRESLRKKSIFSRHFFIHKKTLIASRIKFEFNAQMNLGRDKKSTFKEKFSRLAGNFH